MEEYKVLITTSGIGSRLGDLTKYTNKSLVRVGKKPAISYIIESYPKEIEIVVTLGYYGNHVEDFIKLTYPDRNFTFVLVDKFSGEGSSLAYSILQAKDKLQCPFIFHAADTIINSKIPIPDKNWLGTCYKENHTNYRTISFLKNHIIYDKDDMNSNFVYIGLAGIYDYNKFWLALEKEYKLNSNDTSLCDCHAINKMNIDKWEIHEFPNWLDIGNSSELKYARENINDKFEILDKVDESIFLFEDFVIKFFYNEQICQNRIKRNLLLDGLTPKILGYKPNFYKYEYSKGDLLSDVVNETIFTDFLNWSHKKLWIKQNASIDFKKVCEKFYFTKTLERLNKFYNEHNIENKNTIINGYLVPPVEEMLNILDKDWLCSSESYQFHGDYILDNIIYKDIKNYVLLDWRQDFGGNINEGDIYYDLAKLNHNLLFNHDIVHRNLFEVDITGNEVRCDILRSNILTNCREILHKWIRDNAYDIDKVNILTAIIWLNMSPLHNYKIGEFLYYFGRYNLYKALHKLNNERIF